MQGYREIVGDQIIDRLERVMWAVTAPREGKTGRNPERVHHGPVVVLINEDTGSNGEFFAEAIKRLIDRPPLAEALRSRALKRARELDGR